MQKSKILLNFLPVTFENFNFEIYRKPYNQEKINESHIHKYKLPRLENTHRDYEYYLICFSKQEGFEKYICDDKTNNSLTKKYIQNLLLHALQKSDLEFLYDENPFKNYIDIVLGSLKEGARLISVQPYHLKQFNKIGFLIDYRFKKNPDVPFNREVQKLSLSLDKSYKANTKYYTDKYHILKNFIEEKFLSLFPLVVSTSGYDNDGKVFIQKNFELFDSQYLDKKTYLFKNGRQNSSQYMGIKQFGAYSPVESKVHYAFIFESRFRDFANDIYLGLLGKKFGGLFSGISPLFGINFQRSDVSRIPIDEYNLQSLEEAHKQTLNLKNELPEKEIIGIFLTPEQEVITGETTAYYYLKHLFASSKIPLQVINHERLSKYDTLKWSLANIGLQIFCKLGGTPWRVQPSNEKCLILGLGNAHRYMDDGSIQKYFGYSVCLDSSGVFKKINVLAYHKDKEKYLRNLRSELTSTIKNDVGNEYKKCVLHIPFKIQKEEIKAIQDSIKNIRSESSIDFRVIKINTENKFFGFSSHNTRIPYESTYIKLSNNEYLTWFEGLQFGKENVHKKVGNPVHIQFLREDGESDAQDQSFLQDIINLSGANWRGFNSKLIPISIYYASLIAGYAKEFEEIDDLETVKQEISSIKSPWFL